MGIITTGRPDIENWKISKKQVLVWIPAACFLYCYIVLHATQLPTASIYGNPVECLFVKSVDSRTDRHYISDGGTIVDFREHLGKIANRGWQSPARRVLHQAQSILEGQISKTGLVRSRYSGNFPPPNFSRSTPNLPKHQVKISGKLVICQPHILFCMKGRDYGQKTRTIKN
jgi:hypothetical protein